MALTLELTQSTAVDIPLQVTNPDGSTPTDVFVVADSDGSLTLPRHFNSTLITTANTDPWGIDPEQTTRITTGLLPGDD